MAFGWEHALVQRRNHKLAAVALPNKNARTVLELSLYDGDFRPGFTPGREAVSLRLAVVGNQRTIGVQTIDCSCGHEVRVRREIPGLVKAPKTERNGVGMKTTKLAETTSTLLAGKPS